MSKLVFLIGAYYPNFSAVGYCAHQVMKCLADDLDIAAVSVRDDPAQPLEEVHEGIRILRIETGSRKQRNALSGMTGPLAQIRLFMVRARGALHRLLAPETIDRSLVKAYVDRLNTMDPPPNVIVPSVFPFETVLAALEYKRDNPGTVVVPYLFDDFVESGSLHVLKLARWLKRKRHLKLERRMLTEATAVLAMHPLRRHLEAHFERPLLEKVSYLEHPLLTRPENDEWRRDEGPARLCFTGSLIGKVREPDYLLELMKGVRSGLPVRADFFVMGNAAQKVPTETLPNGIAIANHGRVSKAEANAAVRNADILLNIGEVQGRQVSSKVFEYMSTGKPIIHLAYVMDDAVSNILAKYPLALCLVQDRKRFDENVRMITAFVAENRSKTITYDEVEAIYPEALPETTAKILHPMLKMR